MSTLVLAGVLCAAFIVTSAVVVSARRDQRRGPGHCGPGCPCHACRVMTDFMQRDIDQAMTATDAGVRVPLRLVKGGAEQIRDGAA
jgi:ferredoxin